MGTAKMVASIVGAVVVVVGLIVGNAHSNGVELKDFRADVIAAGFELAPGESVYWEDEVEGKTTESHLEAKVLVHGCTAELERENGFLKFSVDGNDIEDYTLDEALGADGKEKDIKDLNSPTPVQVYDLLRADAEGTYNYCLTA